MSVLGADVDILLEATGKWLTSLNFNFKIDQQNKAILFTMQDDTDITTIRVRIFIKEIGFVMRCVANFTIKPPNLLRMSQALLKRNTTMDVGMYVYDVWCMYVWCVMYDVWCMNVWCMMYDVCCMMYDVWCMYDDVGYWVLDWRDGELALNLSFSFTGMPNLAHFNALLATYTQLAFNTFDEDIIELRKLALSTEGPEHALLAACAAGDFKEVANLLQHTKEKKLNIACEDEVLNTLTGIVYV